MTNTIKFTVHGDPKGQPRPRAFSMGGKVRMYDPSTAEGWKAAIADAFLKAAKAGDWQKAQGAVSVTIELYFKRPKSHYRTGKNSGQLKEPIAYWHTQKPDADNVAKAVLDALTMVNAWQDDALVCELNLTKRWADAEAFTKICLTQGF